MFGSGYWILLSVLLIFSVLFDLAIAFRGSDNLSVKSSIRIFIFWFVVALAINFMIYVKAGTEYAIDFATGYFLELSLSFDNVFLFIIIFRFLDISEKNQHKILFLGILGAVIMRLMMIFFGIYVFDKLSWLFVIFGVILIYSGVKLQYATEKKESFAEGVGIRLVKKVFNYDSDIKDKFFLKKDGRLYISRMTLALILVEKSDALFAIDSIPAILTISNDLFIVFSSNILAILALRAMYFIIAHALKNFRYLKNGVGIILGYVGIKMIVEYFGMKIENFISILFIVMVIVSSIILSRLMRKMEIKK